MLNNRHSHSPRRASLKGPLILAAAVAVLLPLTAFAGIGAWNGVQRVMLGTAVETAPVSKEETAAAEWAVETAPQQSRESASAATKGGFLGVSTTTLTDQLRRRFGVPAGVGVMVSEVNDNSAAYAAGLEAGDVIAAVDGKEIDSQSELARAIRRAGADSTVALDVYRDGRAQSMTATLDAATDRRSSFTWNSDTDGDWSAEGMEAFAERMAEFGERFGEEFGERFGEDWAEQFEDNAEAFGERMEAWGEEFGRRMEERFENGDWDENSFNFHHDGEFDEAEFEEAMERLQVELEGLNFEGLGALIESALAGVDFSAIGTEVSAAIEEAMRALEDHDGR